ncbi:MAG: flippase-like domain-containing protein [Erysipelotrichaceae bacterium]|nr:flippase-like domain-containing protein [Erysipelotrichaceae bacterium]
MKKKKNHYALNFLVIIVLTIAVLFFSLKDDYHDILRLIFNVKWYWFILIISWGLLYNCIIAWIYKTFGRKYKANYSNIEALENAFVGTFFGGITPSATGGQFGQVYIMKKQGIKVSDAASLLWADFIIYQTTMMLYVSVLFLCVFSSVYEKNAFFLLVLCGYVINICVIALLWTMALFPKVFVRFSQWGVILLSKLHIVKNKEKTLQVWTAQMESFTNEIRRLKKDQRLIVKTVLINVLRLTMLYALPYLVCYAMGVELPLSKLVVIIAMSSFVTMANTFIPIPGASGGTEWAFVSIFSTIIPSALAKSVMIFWRFSTYHFVMIVGGLIFLFAKRKYDLIEARRALQERTAQR